MKRYAGLLASEWVTAGIVAVVGTAVGWGIFVGGQRDNMVENAKQTIVAVRDAVAAAAGKDTLLACNNAMVGDSVLRNDYLTFTIGTLPVPAESEQTRHSPAIFLRTEKAVDSNDTFQTTKALHKALDDDDAFTLKTTKHNDDEIAFAVVLSEFPICEATHLVSPATAEVATAPAQP